MLEHLVDSISSRALVETLFLFDDLVQREAFLSGELEQVEPSVLTGGQVRNEEPLPAFLASEEASRRRAAVVDDLWERYFRHASQVAREHRSALLTAWVAHEVGLRNALAGERAKRLGLDSGDYLVASDLAGDEDFSETISQWASSASPLAGLRVLIRARWNWLADHDAWFTFADDELAAYALRLMLIRQWHRLMQSGADRDGDQRAGESGQSLERAR